jgi:hypothetical protein
MDRSDGARFRALRCFAATAIAAALVTPEARAVPLFSLAKTVVTTNGYGGGKSIWITIYDGWKVSHLDYGCVGSVAARSWKSGNYFVGSVYYVRAEVRAGPSCGGATICDTTVQLLPQSSREGTKFTLLPNGANCYWRHDN